MFGSNFEKVTQGWSQNVWGRKVCALTYMVITNQLYTPNVCRTLAQANSRCIFWHSAACHFCKSVVLKEIQISICELCPLCFSKLSPAASQFPEGRPLNGWTHHTLWNERFPVVRLIHWMTVDLLLKQSELQLSHQENRPETNPSRNASGKKCLAQSRPSNDN